MFPKSSGTLTEHGKKAIQAMMDDPDHKSVIGAFYRDTIGPIDLDWGTEGTKERKYEDGWGIAKIK